MSTYFATLTELGEAKIANATALGTTIQLTHMGVGDAYEQESIPDRTQEELLNERYRAPLNRLTVDAANPSQIIVELVLPESVGGWWIREIGVYDEDGYLCAVANCPPSYKPQLSEGSGRTQVVRMVLLVSSTEAVELKIDPSVVLATRGYVEDYVEEFVLEQIAEHEAWSNPHPQYNLTAANLADVADAATALQNLGGTPLAFAMELMPPGAVAHFAMDTAPKGWLKANGALVFRTTYAALFAAIGTTFGAGDGRTTFALPDLRGEFIRGFDDGRGIDIRRAIGTAQAATTHAYAQGTGSNGAVGAYWSDGLREHEWSSKENLAYVTPANGGATFPAGTSYQQGGALLATFTARPRNVALLVCIKY